MFRPFDKRFPLVHSFIGGEVDEALARTILATNAALIERAQREGQGFYFFVNALRVRGVSPAARKLIAEWDAGLSDEQESMMRVRIVLADSLVVRGAISAISWFSPRMRSMLSASNFDAGIQHLSQALDADGRALEAEDVAALRDADTRAESEFRLLLG